MILTLSVLSTPCTKPAANHSAPSVGDGADDAVEEAGDRVGLGGGVGPVVGDRMSTRRRSACGLAQRGEALEAADADVAVAEPDEDRGAGRRRLVAAGQRLADPPTPGLDQMFAARSGWL